MNGRTRARPAVVIMAKRPAPGRTKTRLCPPLSPIEAAALYDAMLSDTVALAGRVAGICVAVAVSPASALETWRPDFPGTTMLFEVDGPTIGACLDAATTSLLERGYSPVMALNSDGPTLPASRIEAACALLEHHDVVMGPSEDGGYYLLGLTRPCPALFGDIPWSTSTVADRTCERALEMGLSLAVLDPWHDVDTPRDLARLSSDLAALPPHVAQSTRRFLARRSTPVSARACGGQRTNE